MRTVLLLAVLSCSATGVDAAALPLSCGHYRVLCGEQRQDPPFQTVRITYGPPSAEKGNGVRWQLEALANDSVDSPILFQLRVETSRDPFSGGEVRLAYDMGARYIWYWTSDHDHHLPWPEQLELTRLLKEHAQVRSRESIRGPKPILDKAIVIPYGYFLVLESPTKRKNAWDLWWVREMDADGTNESSRRYRSLMRQAFLEVQLSFDAGEEFDIIVDDGREIHGYRKVVRLRAD